MGDPNNDEVFASYQFTECRSFSSQICPRDIDGSDFKPDLHTEALPNYMIDGKVNNAEFQQENSINEDAGRNRPRNKARKFLLLSDLLRDLAGPSGGIRVRRNVTNPDNVNGRFVTETEDESDDITLEAFFGKQKGVEVKKKKKMIQVEKPRIDRDKRSKRGSKDENENESDVRVGKRKDCRSENRRAEVCSTAPTKTANEDSEMEAVMLLASRFNEENPQKPANGAKNAQTVQSGTRKKTEIEPLETTKRIRSSPSPSIRKRNYDQRLFANADISNERETGCACVQKKIRKSSTPGCNYESIHFRPLKTLTGGPVFYVENHKKFSKEKLEIRKMKAGRVEWDEENRVNLVCSINRNPAEISIANSENKFMRGG